MEISKKYIKIKENNHDSSTHIKITFCYDIGGMNYFTGREKPRGYYLHAFPVERSARDGYRTECFTAFTGVAECLHECTRKSAKAENTAREKMPEFEKIMIDYIVNKYGYILEE